MFKIKQQTRNIQQCKIIFKTETSNLIMYNEPNSLTRFCLFMKFTLHSVQYMCTWLYRGNCKVTSFILSYTQILQPTCCVKIAQKVTKMHQVFKNVSKL